MVDDQILDADELNTTPQPEDDRPQAADDDRPSRAEDDRPSRADNASEQEPSAESDTDSDATEPADELAASEEQVEATTGDSGETGAEAAGEGAPAEGEAAPQGPQRAWYVVHCYSGYENKVKKGLEQRIVTIPGMQELIFRAVVPTEEEIDLREGQRKVVQRRVFPGYILVEMVQYSPDDPRSKEAWYVVRNTPGVTGFVSSGDIPTPLREDEVNKILKRMETDQPKVRVTYRTGQVVHIIDGPFADFRGTVDEVNMEKGKVRVMVSFFGRETPVELDLLQVEKV
jgi:transcriptional antiterminator NusG